MKNKKAIELLEKLRADVLPKAPQEPATAWQTWATNLRDVATDNLGRDEWDAKKTWDYDPYSGTFSFALHRTVTIETRPGKRTTGSVTTNFTFDPKKPVAEEIARLAGEVEDWSNGLVAMRKLQLADVRNTQGQEAFDDAVKHTFF